MVQELRLHLHIHYAQGVIQSVAMVPSHVKGVTWRFQSPQVDSALETCLENWLEAYSQKKAPSVQHLPLAWDLLPLFTREALKVIGEIPFGSVSTYGQVADRLGMPKGARAVGGACRRNPFLLVIPCHRVLDSTYGYRGYSAGGIAIKQSLLDFEGVSSPS